MKIIINNKRKVADIQNDFSEMFPYLRLEFSAKVHRANNVSIQKMMKHPAKTLGECRSNHKSGSITINPEITVGELEQKFHDVFGLSVQVLRESGKVWLETTMTNSWTLEEQNKQGQELSKSKETRN